ncbi:MAG: aromatic-ring-hydroxylating dioxygenase subunit beta [Actinomycetota bacterium]
MPSLNNDEVAVRMPTADEARQLLFFEARLLDERRYEEWLELFTDDAYYWLPLHTDGASADPHSRISIIYDDAERRAERVFRTLHTPVLDQSPPSRTVHVVSNVEVDSEPFEGSARVWCTQLIAEMRPGGPSQAGLGEPRWFAGRCEHRLRYDHGRWKIALKKLALLNSDRPLYNLTFLL